jgi:hypothetical protein
MELVPPDLCSSGDDRLSFGLQPKTDLGRASAEPRHAGTEGRHPGDHRLDAVPFRQEVLRAIDQDGKRKLKKAPKKRL